MSTCFVMQPFDGGDFDNRYEDVFAPAIEAAGLKPYRVDRDPQVSIPIHDIEKGIRDSRICLADISIDNPNVWFELGFAIASLKEVVLVCSDQRTARFPFDVQHRSIIKYQTGAPRNFETLKHNITERVKGLLEKAHTIHSASAPSMLKQIEGLDANEVVALAVIGENAYASDDWVSIYLVKNDMEKAGYTALAANMGLRTLESRDLVRVQEIQDRDGGEYFACQLTANGWKWMLENKHLFEMEKKNKPKASSGFDEIPF